MQPIFEAAAILFLLFLVLRLSLRRKGSDIRLRGGLVALNVLTGALAGWAAAMAVRAAVLRDGLSPSPAAATGGIDYAAAFLRILPLGGFVLGGIAGNALFGALWRRYLRHGPAAARAWLRRSQFLIAGAALVALVRHLLR